MKIKNAEAVKLQLVSGGNSDQTANIDSAWKSVNFAVRQEQNFLRIGCFSPLLGGNSKWSLNEEYEILMHGM